MRGSFLSSRGARSAAIGSALSGFFARPDMLSRVSLLVKPCSLPSPDFPEVFDSLFSGRGLSTSQDVSSSFPSLPLSSLVLRPVFPSSFFSSSTLFEKSSLASLTALDSGGFASYGSAGKSYPSVLSALSTFAIDSLSVSESDKAKLFDAICDSADLQYWDDSPQDSVKGSLSVGGNAIDRFLDKSPKNSTIPSLRSPHSSIFSQTDSARLYLFDRWIGTTGTAPRAFEPIATELPRKRKLLGAGTSVPRGTSSPKGLLFDSYRSTANSGSGVSPFRDFDGDAKKFLNEFFEVNQYGVFLRPGSDSDLSSASVALSRPLVLLPDSNGKPTPRICLAIFRSAVSKFSAKPSSEDTPILLRWDWMDPIVTSLSGRSKSNLLPERLRQEMSYDAMVPILDGPKLKSGSGLLFTDLLVDSRGSKVTSALKITPACESEKVPRVAPIPLHSNASLLTLSADFLSCASTLFWNRYKNVVKTALCNLQLRTDYFCPGPLVRGARVSGSKNFEESKKVAVQGFNKALKTSFNGKVQASVNPAAYFSNINDVLCGYNSDENSFAYKLFSSKFAPDSLTSQAMAHKELGECVVKGKVPLDISIANALPDGSAAKARVWVSNDKGSLKFEAPELGGLSISQSNYLRYGAQRGLLSAFAQSPKPLVLGEASTGTGKTYSYVFMAANLALMKSDSIPVIAVSSEKELGGVNDLLVKFPNFKNCRALDAATLQKEASSDPSLFSPVKINGEMDAVFTLARLSDFSFKHSLDESLKSSTWIDHLVEMLLQKGVGTREDFADHKKNPGDVVALSGLLSKLMHSDVLIPTVPREKQYITAVALSMLSKQLANELPRREEVTALDGGETSSSSGLASGGRSGIKEIRPRSGGGSRPSKSIVERRLGLGYGSFCDDLHRCLKRQTVSNRGQAELGMVVGTLDAYSFVESTSNPDIIKDSPSVESSKGGENSREGLDVVGHGVVFDGRRKFSRFVSSPESEGGVSGGIALKYQGGGGGSTALDELMYRDCYTATSEPSSSKALEFFVDPDSGINSVSVKYGNAAAWGVACNRPSPGGRLRIANTLPRPVESALFYDIRSSLSDLCDAALTSSYSRLDYSAALRFPLRTSSMKTAASWASSAVGSSGSGGSMLARWLFYRCLSSVYKVVQDEVVKLGGDSGSAPFFGDFKRAVTDIYIAVMCAFSENCSPVGQAVFGPSSYSDIFFQSLASSDAKKGDQRSVGWSGSKSKDKAEKNDMRASRADYEEFFTSILRSSVILSSAAASRDFKFPVRCVGASTDVKTVNLDWGNMMRSVVHNLSADMKGHSVFSSPNSGRNYTLRRVSSSNPFWKMRSSAFSFGALGRSLEPTANAFCMGEHDPHSASELLSSTAQDIASITTPSNGPLSMLASHDCSEHDKAVPLVPLVAESASFNKLAAKARLIGEEVCGTNNPHPEVHSMPFLPKLAALSPVFKASADRTWSPDDVRNTSKYVSKNIDDMGILPIQVREAWSHYLTLAPLCRSMKAKFLFPQVKSIPKMLTDLSDHLSSKLVSDTSWAGKTASAGSATAQETSRLAFKLASDYSKPLMSFVEKGSAIAAPTQIELFKVAKTLLLPPDVLGSWVESVKGVFGDMGYVDKGADAVSSVYLAARRCFEENPVFFVSQWNALIPFLDGAKRCGLADSSRKLTVMVDEVDVLPDPSFNEEEEKTRAGIRELIKETGESASKDSHITFSGVSATLDTTTTQDLFRDAHKITSRESEARDAKTRIFKTKTHKSVSVGPEKYFAETLNFMELFATMSAPGRIVPGEDVIGHKRGQPRMNQLAGDIDVSTGSVSFSLPKIAMTDGIIRNQMDAFEAFESLTVKSGSGTDIVFSAGSGKLPRSACALGVMMEKALRDLLGNEGGALVEQMMTSSDRDSRYVVSTMQQHRTALALVLYSTIVALRDRGAMQDMLNPRNQAVLLTAIENYESEALRAYYRYAKGGQHSLDDREILTTAAKVRMAMHASGNTDPRTSVNDREISLSDARRFLSSPKVLKYMTTIQYQTGTWGKRWARSRQARLQAMAKHLAESVKFLDVAITDLVEFLSSSKLFHWVIENDGIGDGIKGGVPSGVDASVLPPWSALGKAMYHSPTLSLAFNNYKKLEHNASDLLCRFSVQSVRNDIPKFIKETEQGPAGTGRLSPAKKCMIAIADSVRSAYASHQADRVVDKFLLDAESYGESRGYRKSDRLFAYYHKGLEQQVLIDSGADFCAGCLARGIDGGSSKPGGLEEKFSQLAFRMLSSPMNAAPAMFKWLVSSGIIEESKLIEVTGIKPEREYATVKSTMALFEIVTAALIKRCNAGRRLILGSTLLDYSKDSSAGGLRGNVYKSMITSMRGDNKVMESSSDEARKKKWCNLNGALPPSLCYVPVTTDNDLFMTRSKSGGLPAMVASGAVRACYDATDSSFSRSSSMIDIAGVTVVHSDIRSAERRGRDKETSAFYTEMLNFKSKKKQKLESLLSLDDPSVFEDREALEALRIQDTAHRFRKFTVMSKDMTSSTTSQRMGRMRHVSANSHISGTLNQFSFGVKMPSILASFDRISESMMFDYHRYSQKVRRGEDERSEEEGEMSKKMIYVAGLFSSGYEATESLRRINERRKELACSDPSSLQVKEEDDLFILASLVQAVLLFRAEISASDVATNFDHKDRKKNIMANANNFLRFVFLIVSEYYELKRGYDPKDESAKRSRFCLHRVLQLGLNTASVLMSSPHAFRMAMSGDPYGENVLSPDVSSFRKKEAGLLESFDAFDGKLVEGLTGMVQRLDYEDSLLKSTAESLRSGQNSEIDAVAGDGEVDLDKLILTEAEGAAGPLIEKWRQVSDKYQDLIHKEITPFGQAYLGASSLASSEGNSEGDKGGEGSLIRGFNKQLEYLASVKNFVGTGTQGSDGARRVLRERYGSFCNTWKAPSEAYLNVLLDMHSGPMGHLASSQMAISVFGQILEGVNSVPREVAERNDVSGIYIMARRIAEVLSSFSITNASEVENSRKPIARCASIASHLLSDVSKRLGGYFAEGRHRSDLHFIHQLLPALGTMQVMLAALGQRLGVLSKIMASESGLVTGVSDELRPVVKGSIERSDNVVQVLYRSVTSMIGQVYSNVSDVNLASNPRSLNPDFKVGSAAYVSDLVGVFAASIANGNSGEKIAQSLLRFGNFSAATSDVMSGYAGLASLGLAHIAHEELVAYEGSESYAREVRQMVESTRTADCSICSREDLEGLSGFRKAYGRISDALSANPSLVDAYVGHRLSSGVTGKHSKVVDRLFNDAKLEYGPEANRAWNSARGERGDNSLMDFQVSVTAAALGDFSKRLTSFRFDEVGQELYVRLPTTSQLALGKLDVLLDEEGSAGLNALVRSIRSMGLWDELCKCKGLYTGLLNAVVRKMGNAPEISAAEGFRPISAMSSTLVEFMLTAESGKSEFSPLFAEIVSLGNQVLSEKSWLKFGSKYSELVSSKKQNLLHPVAVPLLAAATLKKSPKALLAHIKGCSGPREICDVISAVVSAVHGLGGSSRDLGGVLCEVLAVSSEKLTEFVNHKEFPNTLALILTSLKSVEVRNFDSLKAVGRVFKPFLCKKFILPGRVRKFSLTDDAVKVTTMSLMSFMSTSLAAIYSAGDVRVTDDGLTPSLTRDWSWFATSEFVRQGSIGFGYLPGSFGAELHTSYSESPSLRGSSRRGQNDPKTLESIASSVRAFVENSGGAGGGVSSGSRLGVFASMPFVPMPAELLSAFTGFTKEDIGLVSDLNANFLSRSSSSVVRGAPPQTLGFDSSDAHGARRGAMEYAGFFPSFVWKSADVFQNAHQAFQGAIGAFYAPNSTKKTKAGSKKGSVASPELSLHGDGFGWIPTLRSGATDSLKVRNGVMSVSRILSHLFRSADSAKSGSEIVSSLLSNFARTIEEKFLATKSTCRDPSTASLHLVSLLSQLALLRSFAEGFRYVDPGMFGRVLSGTNLAQYANESITQLFTVDNLTMVSANRISSTGETKALLGHVLHFMHADSTASPGSCLLSSDSLRHVITEARLLHSSVSELKKTHKSDLECILSEEGVLKDVSSLRGFISAYVLVPYVFDFEKDSFSFLEHNYSRDPLLLSDILGEDGSKKPADLSESTEAWSVPKAFFARYNKYQKADTSVYRHIGRLCPELLNEKNMTPEFESRLQECVEKMSAAVDASAVSSGSSADRANHEEVRADVETSGFFTAGSEENLNPSGYVHHGHAKPRSGANRLDYDSEMQNLDQGSRDMVSKFKGLLGTVAPKFPASPQRDSTILQPHHMDSNGPDASPEIGVR